MRVIDIKTGAHSLDKLGCSAPSVPGFCVDFTPSTSTLPDPTKYRYTMALVNPEERTAAASVTSLARSGGAGCSPAFSGLLLQGTMLTLGLPFILAGGLKAAYDLALWAVFRRVPVEQDAVSARASQ